MHLPVEINDAWNLIMFKDITWLVFIYDLPFRVVSTEGRDLATQLMLQQMLFC